MTDSSKGQFLKARLSDTVIDRIRLAIGLSMNGDARHTSYLSLREFMDKKNLFEPEGDETSTLRKGYSSAFNSTLNRVYSNVSRQPKLRMKPLVSHHLHQPSQVLPDIS